MSEVNVVPASESDYKFIECKLTIESSRLLGPTKEEKRVTFDGYATLEMYAAIIDTMKKVCE